MAVGSTLTEWGWAIGAKEIWARCMGFSGDISARRTGRARTIILVRGSISSPRW